MLSTIIIIAITDIILLLVPVIKGSVHEISKLVLTTSIYAVITIWLSAIIINKSYFSINILKISPLILLVLICIIQVIPVPDILLKILSYRSFEYWNSSRILLDGLGDNYSRSFFTVSIYPYATLSSLILLASYISFGVFTAKYFKSRRRIILLIVPILFMTIIEALAGIYQTFTIYGISHSQGAHGTFVNKNHYAGLLELGIPLIIGFIFSFSRNISGSKKKILNSENLLKLSTLTLLLPLVFIAAILSKSRMGIISLFVSMGFLYLNLVYNSHKPKDLRWMILFVFALFISLFLYIGAGPVIERFMDIGYDHRLYVWKDCINIIRDFPLLGSGLGTFEYIYPLYKYNVTIAADYNYAHNDYIQMIIETGILGFLAICTAIAIFFKDTFQFLKINSEKDDSFKYFITLGAFTGVFSILIHSFADFNLHIPSNAVYFTTLIGIIYAVNSNGYESTTSQDSINPLRKRVKLRKEINTNLFR